MLLKQRICIEFTDEEAAEFLALLRFCKKAINEKSLIINNIEIEKDECDIDGAEQETGYKKSSIYGLVHERKIPHYRRGRLLRFSRKELRAWKKPGKTADQIEAEAA